MAISYRAAVEWIALNDETGESDAAVLADLISVCLIADLASKEPIDVAKAVLRHRKRKAIGTSRESASPLRGEG